jgi:hypothetical protein
LYPLKKKLQIRRKPFAHQQLGGNSAGIGRQAAQKPTLEQYRVGDARKMQSRTLF